MLLFYTVPINEENQLEIENYIKGVADGDELAFKRLYEATKTGVYSYALSILKNTYDAEDVMHDCYINIYKSAKDYQYLGKPMAWIFTITKNLSLQKIKTQSKFSELKNQNYDYLVDDVTLNEENKLILKKCFEVLSDEEREIIILHVISGLKHKEIADYKGLLLSTVLSKYNRALKKLKKILEAELTQNEQ